MKTNIVNIVTSLCAVICICSNSYAQWDAPAGFYQNINGTGATLKSQLTSRMSQGHIQRTYGDFRFSASITDADPNAGGRILLVYDQASVQSPWDSGVTWNREHVWPQARQPGTVTNGSQGNLGDPHALRPSDPVVNADRANMPFGFENTTGAARDLGSYWFPGDSDKGDIARSLFYSDTRWTSLGLSLTDSFPSGNQMGDLSSIIAWHYLDPPSEFERRRNHTIFSSAFNPSYFTNNRNAFIDRPEFVWSIYVDQQNDSRIVIDNGTTDSNGSSTLLVDYGSVIVGHSLPPLADQQITLSKQGLDGTYFSVETVGSATSDVDGFNNAFPTGSVGNRTITVGLDADVQTPAITSGMVMIDNLDVTTAGGTGRGANDGDDFIELTFSVLEHSSASFSPNALVSSMSLNLGTFNVGDPVSETLEIHNLASTNPRAALDFDAIARLSQASSTDLSSNAPQSKIKINGSLFNDLPAGQSREFTIVGDSRRPGPRQSIFLLTFSDENLPGETEQTLALQVIYQVVK